MAEPSPTMARPVCHRLPSSVALWDDTNLPLSCVLTPLHQAQPQSSAPSLASIPKCLHCGAPHATTVSHYALHSTLLCHLCGKTCATDFDNQAQHRHEEPMDKKTYGGTRPVGTRSTGTRPTPNRSSSVSGQVLEFSMPVFHSSYEIPAMNCPPIWWIVVEGSPSRQYWNVISSALSSVVADLPPYVHVGLLMASSSSLSVWNVASAVPLVQHYNWKTASPDLLLADVGTYQSHIQTTLRAMGDSLVNTAGQMPLCKTLQIILEQLEGAKHPGQRTSNGSGEGELKPYAGGRVLVLLNGPPQELKGSATTYSRQTGSGGRGGACFEEGMRFSSTSMEDGDIPALAEDDPEMGTKKTTKAPKTNKGNPDNLTSANLKQHFPHVDKALTKQFQQLGQQFADAAFGIDVLVVQNSSQEVGLALLKPLCEPTGAPGPLLFDLTKTNISKALEDELWSRRPMSFGGLLRVRLSPGFKVDTSPVDATSRSPLELADLHVRKGLMGPATATKEDSLWQVGSCDPHQTMTLDLQVTNKIKRFAFVDVMGEVALKPCLQVCFAYTTIVASEENPEEYVTIRRMRICTLHLPMANDVESLYATLDPEALSVVLFHKLTMSVLTEGLAETQDIGRNWLKFILVCAYRSAEAAHKRQKSKAEQGVESEVMFFPAERLLDIDGSLTKEEILLGQGHDILRLLPLLVWCILQCDAMRPSSDTYRPTLDARSAALMQLTSMPPLVLARCIAPRLELWQSGMDAKEPIVTTLGLSVESIAAYLMEYQQADPNLILFLDSPYGIIVCDSRHLRAAEGNGVVVGDALQSAILQAVDSYQTPPPVTYALDLNVPIGHLWKDVLVEDALAGDSMHNFEQWKQELATSIFEELAEGAEY